MRLQTCGLFYILGMLDFLETVVANPVCNHGDQPPVSLGDPIILCVFVSLQPPRKMIFRVKVEQNAKLLLSGSQKAALANRSSPLHTWVTASQSSPANPLDCSNSLDTQSRSHAASCPMVYANPNYVVQFLNLVINLRDGLISSFAWDNGCQGCGPSNCMASSQTLDMANGKASDAKLSQGACGQEVSRCTDGSPTCDLKIFVTWAGTDKNGRNALSAGMRLSKFTGSTLSSLYDTMSTNYNQAVSR